MLLRKRCRSLLCQLQILVLMLALLLLILMMAVLDLEVQSEENSVYLNQNHGGGGRGWAGSILESIEETNEYKMEVLSPLSSLRDEELIAIGMFGSPRSVDKVRKNMYRIVKQPSRKIENDVVTNNEQARNIHGFAEDSGERTSLHRVIPEGRHSLCLQQIYNENLPTASIIITFHNEAWSTLLRTVHSVLDNSPSRILKEIILVDDLSHQGHLKTALSEYVSRFGGVKIIRSNKRLGVIGGRMLGAARATGEILVFMDPHCECHPGWLEPLLSRIMNNRNCIVSPVLDVIDWRTFKYYHSTDLRQGVFDWNLDFHWVTLPESEQKVRQSPILPFRTPVIPGCVIAVDRHYFQNIGAFDTFMNVSGVENIELSIRVWLCGGSVEIVPCSRVGHLLQNQTYNTYQNETLRNKIRITEVWMDSYKDIFYHSIGKELVTKLIEMNDVTELKQLRLRLGCKGFTWFLSNIDPAMNSTYSMLHSTGQLFNSGLGQCLQYSYNRFIQLVELSSCEGNVNQVLEYYNKKILLGVNDSLCLNVRNDKLLPGNCALSDISTWDFNESGLVKHLPSGKCMEPEQTQTGNTFIFIKPCNYRQKNQFWKIIPK